MVWLCNNKEISLVRLFSNKTNMKTIKILDGDPTFKNMLMWHLEHMAPPYLGLTQLAPQ